MHCGVRETDACLELKMWRKRWSAAGWREYLTAGESEAELAAIRQCTHTGRPLGNSDFVHSLEELTQRRLVAQTGGRPGNPSGDGTQKMFAFWKES